MSAPHLSFITVCKGRLAHLKQTLPLLAAQPDAETIVVDYGCPQGTRSWVRERFPGARVVPVDDDPGFCVARGRNLGAAAARAPRLCFVDADIRLGEGFAAWARENARPRHYYRALPASEDTWGTCICWAEDFSGAGGYDEAFRGWGGEDDDLYIRLEDAGCLPSSFPAGLAEPIAHPDDTRLAQYEIKDKRTHNRVSQVYVTAKRHLAKLLARPLSLEERKRLFAESQRGVQSVPVGDGSVVLEINLPPDPRLPSHDGWALEQQVVYRFVPRPD
jgi:glycosyltransferase involved in cell wall biosynthesis